MNYWLHFTTGNNFTGLTEIAAEEAWRKWFCPGGKHLKAGIRRGLNAHIRDEDPKGSLSRIGIYLPLATRAFLMQFGEKRIRRDLYIGSVYGPDGALMREWVTYRGKHGLIVRGKADAAYRVCKQCGRVLYFAGPKSYLYPEPMPGPELFQSDECGLIVSERLVKELNIPKPRGIMVERLPVLAEPLDGFPPLTFEP